MLFVGLGSPHGDDQIGWRIAEELRGRVSDSDPVSVRTATIPLDLIDWLDGVDRLHLCDACLSEVPPGTLLRFEASHADSRLQLPELAGLRSRGSHDFALPDVLELAFRLDRLPAEVVVHAVSSRRFQPGDGLSDALRAALPQITGSILRELRPPSSDASDAG